jgi:phosphatidylcholine synthase
MRPSADGPWTAIGVHVFTALGAVCAFFATLALIGGSPERMFLWLGAALLIDGLDGPMARRLNVAERLPRFSGERLDLVIDFITSSSAAVAGGRSPARSLASGGIPASSLFHFADLESKAETTAAGFRPSGTRRVLSLAFDAGPLRPRWWPAPASC